MRATPCDLMGWVNVKGHFKRHSFQDSSFPIPLLNRYITISPNLLMYLAYGDAHEVCTAWTGFLLVTSAGGEKERVRCFL